MHQKMKFMLISFNIKWPFFYLLEFDLCLQKMQTLPLFKRLNCIRFAVCKTEQSIFPHRKNYKIYNWKIWCIKIRIFSFFLFLFVFVLATLKCILRQKMNHEWRHKLSNILLDWFAIYINLIFLAVYLCVKGWNGFNDSLWLYIFYILS